MDIPNSDIVIPIAIITVCLVVVFITFRLTRQRAKGWQLEDLNDGTDVDDTLIDIDALDEWHRDYGSVVTTWIDSHEETLDALSRSGLQLDLTARSPGVEVEVDTRMREAVTAHPTPAMRAQLSAMTVAADATVVAVRRSDYETAEKQHITYIEYRDQWLYRLRQFSPNDQQIGAVAAEANRHGADWALRPVPDIEPTRPEPHPGAANEAEDDTPPAAEDAAQTGESDGAALVTELNTDQPDGPTEPKGEDPWQISRPRKSRRKRRRAG